MKIKKSIISLTALFFMLFNFSLYGDLAKASEVKSVYCEYNYGNKSIVTSLKNNKNSTTNLMVDDMEAILFIKNVDNLSELEDYILFKKDNKNIIFPLKCKKL